jgi:hypothetical protein
MIPILKTPILNALAAEFGYAAHIDLERVHFFKDPGQPATIFVKIDGKISGEEFQRGWERFQYVSSVDIDFAFLP